MWHIKFWRSWNFKRIAEIRALLPPIDSESIFIYVGNRLKNRIITDFHQWHGIRDIGRRRRREPFAQSHWINSIIVLYSAVAKWIIINLVFRIPRDWLYKDSVNRLHFVPRAIDLRRSILVFLSTFFAKRKIMTRLRICCRCCMSFIYYVG